MISNTPYPVLDSDFPAGLSRTGMHDELRERLGFEGVTTADGLEAGELRPVSRWVGVRALGRKWVRGFPKSG